MLSHLNSYILSKERKNTVKKNHIFLISFFIIVICIVLISGFRESDKPLEMKINDVELEKITSDQIKEDFDALVEVLNDTGTDNIVDERVHNFDIQDFKKRQYEKIDGEFTVKELYGISKKILPNRSRHTRLMEPKEIIEGRRSASSSELFSHEMRYDPVTIRKNEGLNKILNRSAKRITYETAGITDYRNILFSSSVTKSGSGIPTMKILEENRTAYIKFPTFSIDDSYKIPLLYFIEEIKDYEYLIIDITGNSGGRIEPWHDLMSELTSNDLYMEYYAGYRDTEIAKTVKGEALEGKLTNGVPGFKNLGFEQVENLPEHMDSVSEDDLAQLKYLLKMTDRIEAKKENNFRGKIYLLIDKKCFSSADLFAHYAKYTKFATIVGSAAAGDGTGGIGYLYFPLPNSGFIYQIQCAYGFNDDGSSNFESGTQPDIVVAPRKELDYVLNEINRGSMSD